MPKTVRFSLYCTCWFSSFLELVNAIQSKLDRTLYLSSLTVKMNLYLFWYFNLPTKENKRMKILLFRDNQVGNRTLACSLDSKIIDYGEKIDWPKSLSRTMNIHVYITNHTFIYYIYEIYLRVFKIHTLREIIKGSDVWCRKKSTKYET